jgi:hypothetical protein
MTRTSSGRTVSSSATTWDRVVSMPWPISIIPVSSITPPSGVTRTIAGS